ncbi:hypothetical protein RZN22_10315 [Bacillaceae bacterium S4-13-58]
MKKYILLLLIIFCIYQPKNTRASLEAHKVVSNLEDENITLYAKKIDGLYQDFKIDFKGTIYTEPFWMSVADNPTYAPKIHYEDINKDKKEELIVILTKGYGTGVLMEEVHVYDRRNDYLHELFVDEPLAIIYKNVKTKLTKKKAEISLNGDKYKVDLKSHPKELYEEVSFGGIKDFEIKDQQLIVKVSVHVSPTQSVGNVVIVYEYRDNMY